MITVHHFSVWDGQAEQMIVPPLKSPAERIRRLGGTIIPGTDERVHESALDLHGRYRPRV